MCRNPECKATHTSDRQALTEHQWAINALMNRTIGKPILVSGHGEPTGNSYTFRFWSMGNGHSYALVTFRCKQTNQADSTSVYSVEDMEDYDRTYPGAAWAKLTREAIYRWRAEAKEVA